MSRGSRTEDYAYTLPDGLIARYPAAVRDQSRLMVVHRGTTSVEHRRFLDLSTLMEPGDALVVNDSRVRAARFLGKRKSGAPAEVLLVRPIPDSTSLGQASTRNEEVWDALVHPGSKLKPGRVVVVAEDLEIQIGEPTPDGGRTVTLRSPGSVAGARARHGVMPLPPYMGRDAEVEDVERYQTVYANEEGSVAAPTAGLHFTHELLTRIEGKGISIVPIRLDVGVGTFRPVNADDPADHTMHQEWYEVSEESAAKLCEVRERGGKVWAVGTTAVRVLETVAQRAVSDNTIESGSGWTDLFIRPGFQFQVVDRLITNFHLPRSTLLMLVAAFAGYQTAMNSYASALNADYRFYSYGDAMVIL